VRDPAVTKAAMGRAGRRAGIHLLQAVVESLKALEAVIEELGGITDRRDDDDVRRHKQKIEIE
jgi:hypothetical protein